MEKVIIEGGASPVEIVGLSEIDGIKSAAFDGITVTLIGAAVDNFGDLTVKGGSADNGIGVRRIIWKGKVEGVERQTVLIVDNVKTGKLRGGWLIFGDAENCLTYYTDSSKLTAKSTGEIKDESAAINLQFVDKKTALTPRTFTFMEKYSMLSLGSAFNHVTITASNHNDIYLSRTVNQVTKINGVIKRGTTAQIDDNNWKFSDEKSFAVETDEDVVKFYDGGSL